MMMGGELVSDERGVARRKERQMLICKSEGVLITVDKNIIIFSVCRSFEGIRMMTLYQWS